MNTLEIHNAMMSNSKTQKKFMGVFSIDQIPKIFKTRSAMLIVNTDPSNMIGTHWFAIYQLRKGCIEFFDSYGRIPTKRQFNYFFKKNNNNNKCFIYNPKQLQSFYSDDCGKYCCMFLYYRSMGVSMQKFIKKFSDDDFLKNDKQIQTLFKNTFKIRNTVKYSRQIK